MKQLAIYFNPSDYPGQYIVRGWVIGYPNPIPDLEPMYIGDSIEEARDIARSKKLFNVGRSSNDDSVLIEVWV